ncbi:hypothetical protein [Edaphobacter modestus]|uniref:Uncharacterized protein n=1 Tax=Edaphobacter modestus TaxID=388466 RepID=A0A4Q7YDP8_9BACT|nr:hypothetical protein [Edaphobacter modestus]RZU35427.1 hypothetical protein BDD14_5474 [Edaphobacter modestus]
MQSIEIAPDARKEAVRIGRSKHDADRVLQCVREIAESAAFRNSQRSGQFLIYIVEQAIAGNFDALKERLIGIELFGRSATYDTGEDAIVRVTASDVRKRLLQYYGQFGEAMEWRVTLPRGCYIPELIHSPQHDKPDTGGTFASTAIEEVPAVAETPQATTAALSHVEALTGRSPLKQGTLTLAIAVTCFASALLTFSGCWFWLGHTTSGSQAPPVWAGLLDPHQPLRIITSDPNIAEIQGLTGQRITVSDYANHRYIPDPSKVSPVSLVFANNILRGDKVAAVDASIVADVAATAQRYDTDVLVRTARAIQLSDLATDGNYVVIGSPLTNPWSSLYLANADFRFAREPSGREYIEDIKPETGEKPQYTPSALGFATGQSLAIVAYLRNPDHRGHVLVLAGLNGEGTEAAGQFAVDAHRMEEALRGCGYTSGREVGNVEILLQLNMMAGLPSHVVMLSCHQLQY